MTRNFWVICRDGYFLTPGWEWTTNIERAREISSKREAVESLEPGEYVVQIKATYSYEVVQDKGKTHNE